MRKQEKIIVWPSYFDSTKTRKNGRKIPKTLAVSLPKILEIKDAAEKIGLGCELVPDVGYSKTPWVKTGMILVKKNQSKNNTLRAIAKQLQNTRSIPTTK